MCSEQAAIVQLLLQSTRLLYNTEKSSDIKKKYMTSLFVCICVSVCFAVIAHQEVPTSSSAAKVSALTS